MTTEKILPGDGWRLIDKEKDEPREGDQYLYWNKWRDRPKPLDPWDFTHTYRRRIPAKPEAIQIRDKKLFMDLENDVVISDGFANSYIYRNELRPVIAWLQQVAEWREWREAQDSK
jgi:hypothetical protein